MPRTSKLKGMPIIHGIHEALGSSYAVIGLSGLTEPQNELATASTLTVVSDNTNDTSEGTGAKTVVLNGIDSSGAHLNEVVSMNGTTGVTTSNTYKFLRSIEVNTIGSAGQQGVVTIANGGTTIAKIDPNYGVTVDAIKTNVDSVRLKKLTFSPEYTATRQSFQIDVCVKYLASRVLVVRTFIVDNDKCTHEFDLNEELIHGQLFVRAKNLGTATVRASVSLSYE